MDDERAPDEREEVEIDGRVVEVSNLHKVLYPETGFTKGEVIGYYARIAPVLVPHLSGRCITFHRFPDGVDGEGFYEKRCPKHRPEWVTTATGPGTERPVHCVLDHAASIVWAANLAAIELHAPMALAADIESPHLLVFDFDPGPPAGMAECAQVGMLIRDVLAGFGLVAFPKTSGSKGLQLYVPLNVDHGHEHCAEFAKACAQLLELRHPDLVTSNMRKVNRSGKVLIDWSQNRFTKTTIAVYSLRARPHPTVSTPVTWDEVESAAGGSPLSFEAPDVLDRVERFGDLFAPTLTLVQHLPAPRQ